MNEKLRNIKKGDNVIICPVGGFGAIKHEVVKLDPLLGILWINNKENDLSYESWSAYSLDDGLQINPTVIEKMTLIQFFISDIIEK